MRSLDLYTFSLDFQVEANSKEEASKEIKKIIVADAKDNLTEENIDAWLGDELTFSHIAEFATTED